MYLESRKMVLLTLFAGRKCRPRHRALDALLHRATRWDPAEKFKEWQGAWQTS